MKGASAIALLAPMAGVNAFVGPAVVPRVRPGTAAASSSSLKMSADAERKPPGDVKLDQGVMDRRVSADLICEPRGPPTRTQNVLRRVLFSFLPYDIYLSLIHI